MPRHRRSVDDMTIETAIDLETDAKLVAVAALDAKGRTLAVSKTVER